jgi:hypothetical protein
MLAALAVLTAVVLADVTPPPSPAPAAAAAPLEISAALVAGALRAGEHATFRVSVRNRSPLPQRLGGLRWTSWTFHNKWGGASASNMSSRSPHDPRCPAARLLAPDEVATFDVVLELEGAPPGRGSVELRVDFEYLDGARCVEQSLSWTHAARVAARRRR